MNEYRFPTLRRTIVFLLLLTLSIILLFSLYIININSKYSSSSLIPVISKDEKVERLDYKDANGKLHIASDLGYATRIITQLQSGEYEEYFDEKGRAVYKDKEYHGLLREFDDNGNTIRITYYDLNMQPCINKAGYAIEERIFDADRQLISVKYFDPENKPVCTPAYGYGKLNEYNINGKISKITFLDKYNNPMVTDYGYASIVKEYYVSDGADDGRTRKELYFGSDNQPISLALGQYGVYKEYDSTGNTSVLTFLDAEGKPHINKMGYSTVKYIFSDNDNTKIEMYFDTDGNPVRLPEGQYGVKRTSGKIAYLGKDGKEIFNLKNLLYNNPYLVLFAVLIISLLSSFLNKNANYLLFLIFCMCIIYITLMYRESTTPQARLELFWSYKQFLQNNGVRTQILRNILLFIPLGTILYNINNEKKVLLFPFLFSLGIEIVQYFTGMGLCEIDDIISNCIGSVLGYVIGKYFSMILSGNNFKHHN